MYFKMIIKKLEIALLFLIGALVSNCSIYSQKLISYSKEGVSVTHDLNNINNEVSILFVMDFSASMGEEKLVFSKNISNLSVLFEKKKYFNYNFGIALMAPYDSNSDYKMLHIPPKLLSHEGQLSCIPSDTSNKVRFVQHSSMGDFFRFTPRDIKNFTKDELFCFLSKSLEFQYSGNPSSNANQSRFSKGGNSNISTNTSRLMFDLEHYFQPIEAMMRLMGGGAVQTGSVYEKFFGADSYLIVIFISDATGDSYLKKLKDNNTNLVADRIENVVSRQFSDSFYSKITNYKRSDQIRFYGVIQTPTDSCSAAGRSYEGGPPYHVLSLIQKTGGTAFPLCAEDWGSYIGVIASDLGHFLKTSKFFLESIPLSNSLEVFYNNKKIDQNVEGGWYYDPESVSITLDLGDRGYQNPNDGNHIKIKYNPVNIETYFQE